MRYIVAVLRGQSKADAFAAALAEGRGWLPSAVYVVGVDEAVALKMALTEQQFHEFDGTAAKALMQFSFAEAIGTEERQGDLPRLVEWAEQRIREIRRQRGQHD